MSSSSTECVSQQYRTFQQLQSLLSPYYTYQLQRCGQEASVWHIHLFFSLWLELRANTNTAKTWSITFSTGKKRQEKQFEMTPPLNGKFQVEFYRLGPKGSLSSLQTQEHKHSFMFSKRTMSNALRFSRSWINMVIENTHRLMRTLEIWTTVRNNEQEI